MAMNWIKGLVAPAAFGVAQQQASSYGVDAPPVGGMGAPVQPGMQPPAAPFGGVPGAMEWSVGTRTQGGSGQAPPAHVAQLQHDVESLALFARTLLTMLEEAKVVTREQFEATKQRLDLLDGKLDDR